MIKKQKRGFFSRYKITLPGNTKNRGVGFCKKANKYFISYQVEGKLERRFIQANSPEEAITERERIFTELLMSGAATRVGEKVKGPRKKKYTTLDLPDKKLGIVGVEIKKTVWRVYVQDKYRGVRSNKEAAIKLRASILEAEAFKPCLACGKRPKLIPRKGQHLSFEHAECTNAVWIRRISKGEAQKQWNSKLFKRVNPKDIENFEI